MYHHCCLATGRNAAVVDSGPVSEGFSGKGGSNQYVACALLKAPHMEKQIYFVGKKNQKEKKGEKKTVRKRNNCYCKLSLSPISNTFFGYVKAYKAQIN